MTRHTQYLAGITAVALSALALSACNPSSGKELGPTSTSISSPAPTTQSTTTPSPSKTETLAERDKREAGEAVVALWGGIDAVASDPNKSLSSLSNYAAGQALTHWQRTVTLMRGDEVKQVGSVKVAVLDASPKPKSGLFEVSACVDVSKVNVVDEKGKSVVSANREPRTSYTYEVSKIDGKFYVTKDPLQGKPC